MTAYVPTYYYYYCQYYYSHQFTKDFSAVVIVTISRQYILVGD